MGVPFRLASNLLSKDRKGPVYRKSLNWTYTRTTCVAAKLGANQAGPEAQIIEFFRNRGFKVTAPITVRGISGFDEIFDISAVKGQEEIVLDIAAVDSAVGPEKVVAFFAKIFDTKPRRPILICIPTMNHAANSLATMYKMETVTSSNIDGVLVKLTGIFG